MTDPTISAILRLCGALKNPQDPERQADLAMLAQGAKGEAPARPAAATWVAHSDALPPSAVLDGSIVLTRDRDGYHTVWYPGSDPAPDSGGRQDVRKYSHWLLILDPTP